MEQSIEDFKSKNTAFNNGYIKGADDGTTLKLLSDDPRVANAYYQYILTNVTLTFDDQTQRIAEKIPMPKATEILSYGVLPRAGMDEIAITPSLANKFSADIQTLIDKSILVKISGTEYSLTVSGIE